MNPDPFAWGMVICGLLVVISTKWGVRQRERAEKAEAELAAIREKTSDSGSRAIDEQPKPPDSSYVVSPVPTKMAPPARAKRETRE